jgi:gamma-glutamylcyclotransferase (GGCT)/AIG2-like uncharacterized protein YtfP
MIAIFVYGTLQRKGRYAKQFVKYRKACEPVKITKHKLYTNGTYPLMIPSDDETDEVYGELHLYNQPKEVLKAMHRIEGYRENDPKHSLFVFKHVSNAEIQGKKYRVYAYLYNGDVSGKSLLVKGKWKK